MKTIKISHNPIAFCFLLRSMFEISAKLYFDENSISLKKSTGYDKTLVEILKDVKNHLTSSSTDKAKLKELHGAMVEMGRKDGILSVTSLNQLVHNPKFSISPSDISTLFGNIFPLLSSMNT